MRCRSLFQAAAKPLLRQSPVGSIENRHPGGKWTNVIRATQHAYGAPGGWRD